MTGENRATEKVTTVEDMATGNDALTGTGSEALNKTKLNTHSGGSVITGENLATLGGA